MRIRYYRQMKKSRVYNFVVSWDSEFQYRGPEQNVSVRLLAGGAQVVPAEVQLDPNDPKDQALFHVTPLAKGWMRGEKVEVAVNGKKVQEIQLFSKAVSHRSTWLFFFLMFVGPWFVASAIQKDHLNRNVMVDVHTAIEKSVPDTPAFIKENVPAVDTALSRFWVLLAVCAEQLHFLAWDYPLPFYTGLAFFILMLLSAFVNRDKRRTLVGKPLFLPRPPTDDEGAEDE
ncbi:MAG: hypothetical protein U0793_08825 [Gemmataceae bacterium]